MLKNWRQVLIITDSVGAPRAKPLYTPYSKTWVSILEDKLLKYGYKTFAYTKRALDSTVLESRMKVELFGYEPEIIIFQIGLCDCAPRALTDLELRIIKRIPLINRMIHKLIKRYYAQISQKRNIAYTNIKNFYSNLEKIIKQFSESKIFFIPIGIPCSGYTDKSPEIKNRIIKYNKVISEVATSNNCSVLNNTIISNNTETEKIYCDDFQHLNFYGHLELSHDILQSIKNKI
jgi:hypothetical protein